ncbi:hypothetical protein C5167_007175 [Papaver somniferum]|uniref:Uncharacterized protein n=1 Tax=Papaver somniferum TaxID=3469 RepID=A0A4Y7JIV6_PAPSO|nr:hypothetical protein C5167_007175 [Papaver somniferum]
MFAVVQVRYAEANVATWGMSIPGQNLPPNVINQLAKELKNLDEIPPEGIKVVINDDDFSTIFAYIEGPQVVKCLLIEPFPESSLNEHSGKMLLEDYEEYVRLAGPLLKVFH